MSELAAALVPADGSSAEGVVREVAREYERRRGEGVPRRDVGTPMSGLITALSTPRPRPRRNIIAGIGFKYYATVGVRLGRPGAHGLSLSRGLALAHASAVAQPALAPLAPRGETKAHNHH
jgi:hypothetical protein